MRRQFAWLGPVGALRPIPNPLPGVTVASGRVVTEQVWFDGTRDVQQSALGARTWRLSYDLCTPAQLAFLEGCATGAYTDDLYLAVGDAPNQLPPRVAAPGLGGDDLLGPPEREGLVVDGLRMSSVRGVSQYGGERGPWSPWVPLDATRTTGPWWVRAWIGTGPAVGGGTSPGIRVQYLDADGALTEQGLEIQFMPPDFVYPMAREVPPQAVALRVCTACAQGARLAALALTLDRDGPWLPGGGGGKVVVVAGDRTIARAWPGDVRAGQEFTFMEVS